MAFLRQIILSTAVILLEGIGLGLSVQNSFGSPSLFQSNIISNNNRPISFPHSIRNLNPYLDSQVSNGQLFRAKFQNPNQFLFGRPLRLTTHDSPTQTILDRSARNPQTIQFSTPVNRNPGAAASRVPVITDAHRNAAINFGNAGPPPPGSRPRIPSVNNPSVVSFPGSSVQPAVAATTDFIDDPNCSLKNSLVMFNGECVGLLEQNSCPTDHWLVLSQDRIPYCSNRECPWDRLRYNGDCVDPSDFEICRPGQILYVHLTGAVECDCESMYYYHHPTGECYAEHDQGFCTAGFYIERNGGGNLNCVTNPCENDKYVQHEGSCFVKNFIGFCPPAQVEIIPDSGTADCSYIQPNSIFQIPTPRSCPAGSKQDYFGKCRGEFIVPTVKSTPSTQGSCQSGFVKDQKGTCRKVFSLFTA